MELRVKKMFKKDDNQFITIATTEYNGKVYAFSNKIDEEKDEVTDEYNVFTIENNEIVYVNDKELINKLLPIFQEQIKNELEKIMKDDNDRGI